MHSPTGPGLDSSGNNPSYTPCKSAASRLFDLPELLEKVLSHLSERDLLRLQRISQVKAVTDGSVPLRRKLFLIAEPAGTSKPRLNPLLFGGEDFFSQNDENVVFAEKLMPVLVTQLIDGKSKAPELRYKFDLVLCPGEQVQPWSAGSYKNMCRLEDAWIEDGLDEDACPTMTGFRRTGLIRPTQC